MRLNTVEAFLARIDFESTPTSQRIAAENLKAATPAIATNLRQDTFAITSNVDVFPIHRMNTFTYTETRALCLNNGFITNIPTVQTKPLGFSFENEYSTVRDTYYSYNPQLGVINLTNFDFTGSEIKVTYNSGFVTEGSEGEDETGEMQYQHFRGVPDWLMEAALVKAIMLLDQNNPTYRHDGKDSAESSIQNMDATYWDLIARYVRVIPLSVSPNL